MLLVWISSAKTGDGLVSYLKWWVYLDLISWLFILHVEIVFYLNLGVLEMYFYWFEILTF